MTEKEVFLLRKKYFSMQKNLFKAVKHSFLTGNEFKIMEREVLKAKHEWEEAEEISKVR